ncbi:MAG TPA: hypothetical protein VNZ57_15785 [Longimicrobiales bacterium]|nr:hypothetical protein [Longimicrobiales bacterium]
MNGNSGGSTVHGSAMPIRRNGFVLMAALWLIVALAAVALDASIRSKSRRVAAANVLDTTRATAAAMAGEAYVRARLTDALLEQIDVLRAAANQRRRGGGGRQPNIRDLFRNADPTEDPWRDPQQLVPAEFELAADGARFSVRVRDPGAALNINAADEEMLRSFFADGLGVDWADADRLAQSILDWRDEDDIPRLNGAEREQYIDVAAAVLPANREFDDIDDLRHVMGMTPEVWEAARPFLTVLGSGRINVNAAPEQVLVALPGITPGVAAEIVRLREAGQLPRSLNALNRLLPSAAAAAIDREENRFERLATFRTDEVEVVSDGVVPGSPIRVRATALYQRSEDGAVLVWSRIDR